MEKTSNAAAAAEEQERQGKEAQEQQQLKCVWVEGPIIVGAGPSGLATAACLKTKGLAFEMLERADCVASLWQHRTYDRLHLHLPKYFCELPLMAFPRHFPTYPTKHQFVEYVEEYVRAFGICPRFNECVCAASFDGALGMWRVRAANAKTGAHTEFLSRWLVVATGENAEPVEPGLAGREAFQGSVRHVCHYKSGAEYRGKRVLVVGCGNSGMEVCLDLINHNASPAVVVRSSVHVLPREIAGVPTFGIAMALMKRLPVKLVDRLLLLLARFIVGDTERYGLPRPSTGPMELKNEAGKTPVLDIGALEHIKRGDIKVLPGVDRLTSRGAKFADGRELEFDSVIWATGYRSNVPSWLKDCCDLFTDKGVPRRPFPNGWKGNKGLYTVGFTKRGLLGASVDAQHIAQDIAAQFRLHQNAIGSLPTLSKERTRTMIRSDPELNFACWLSLQDTGSKHLAFGF